MNRIPKAVYMKEFREEAVKLALTEGVGELAYSSAVRHSAAGAARDHGIYRDLL